MITWHQITDPMTYEQDRFDEIRALEGVRSLPYLAAEETVSGTVPSTHRSAILMSATQPM